MDVDYDPAKNERNIRERGLSFERVREFDFTDHEGEVRELTRTDFARTKPFSSLPPELQIKLLSLKRTAAPVADQDTIPVPLSRAVVEQFRASGDGWQGRMDKALREWLDEHKAS